jgi:hypothetical protein
MIDAMRRKTLAFQTETVARTAALDAQKLAQRLSWEDAIAKGIVERDELEKTWVGVMDDRERATHVAMEKVTVGFDEPFVLPDGKRQQIPGDNRVQLPLHRALLAPARGVAAIVTGTAAAAAQAGAV